MIPGILKGIKERFGEEKIIFPEQPEEIIVRGIGLAFTDSVPKKESKKKKKEPRSRGKPRTKKDIWRLVHENGTVVEINKEIMIAGRSNEADIRLDSKKCSRTHALVRLEDGDLSVLDLRSKNGTAVNQIDLTPSTPYILQEGDIVRLGDQNFTVE
jgi:hypothetical protein